MKIKFILCISAFAFAHGAFAQDSAFAPTTTEHASEVGVKVSESRPIEPNTYGTATLTRLYVASPAFEPRLPATTWGFSGGFARYSNGALHAAVMVPAGASVEKIGIRACDSSAAEQVLLNFGPCNSIGGPCTLAGSVATGAAATPGCNEFEVTLAVPVNVSATASRMLLAEITTGNSTATTFDGVYVDYRLRISPPPGAASFTDVPMDHQFFQHIEALKASGVTSGCSPTTYCPGQAVTRAEMAAFLARALGLHWAP